MTKRSFAPLWSLSYTDMDFLSPFGDPDVIAYVADQTGAPDDASYAYAFSSDTARRPRWLILDFLGVRRATSRDREKLQV